MASPIPIQNIYYLLVYSWNSLTEGEIADVSRLESHELVDLFALVLTKGINHLLRRGLHKDYRLHQEEIAGVRGRINIGITARRMLAPHGLAYCHFDELSVDTLPNQILLATTNKLLKTSNLSPELAFGLRKVRNSLSGITEIHLNRHVFRRVQLHGNNRAYRFLLRVCELVVDFALVDQKEGSFKFRDFLRNERQMARLFENFIFNFYKIHRPELSVKKEHIYWNAKSASDPELHFLPKMETDISLRDLSAQKTLIIDAKYYKETFQSFYDKRTIHSGNLYQIFAYLKNLESRGGADGRAEGMLLYPVIDRSVRLDYEIQDHVIRVCTVDLSAGWKEIHEELLDLLTI